jgi:hypothetical protein
MYGVCVILDFVTEGHFTDPTAVVDQVVADKNGALLASDKTDVSLLPGGKVVGYFCRNFSHSQHFLKTFYSGIDSMLLFHHVRYVNAH